jgi:glycosyltransferase involved in cell wall biosynthesis
VAYLIGPARVGVEKQVESLISGLDREQFEPIVICPPGTPFFAGLKEAGHRLTPLGLAPNFRLIRELWPLLKLRFILWRLKPTILHIHGARSAWLGRLAAMSPRRRIRVILTLHDFPFDERTAWARRVWRSWLERRLLRFTDAIVAVSKALKESLVSEMRLKAQKITVTYPGIISGEFERRPHEGIRVGTWTRLAPGRGVEDFIRAAALVKTKHPDVRFTIVGDGPLRGSLEMLAGVMGVSESTEFLGFRPDAADLVAGFDVFVFTPLREVLGLALVEALARKVPVVASNVGGIPEVVDGTTGLLAKAGDAHDIADQICRLLEDPKLAHRMAEEGFRAVRDRFGPDRMISETQALYLEVLRTPEKRPRRLLARIRDRLRRRRIAENTETQKGAEVTE